MRTVKYTDCISAEGWDYPIVCLEYDIKQSDREALVLAVLRNVEYTFIAFAPSFTLTQSRSTW